MKKTYENTIAMMTQGDQMLAELLSKYISEFPDLLVSKIEKRKKDGIVFKDNKRWMFEDNENELSISVGKNDASCKDIMSLLITSTTDERLKSWPKFEGERLIGSITFYLYNPNNRKEKPLRASYDFYAKRIEKSIVMTISTNVNASFKENAERLEEYGLSEIHHNIINNHYVLDVDRILRSESR